MTSISNTNIRRTGIAAVAALAALTFQTTGAFAVPNSVKVACLGDYLSYCSSHRPGSSSLNRCMRRNGTKLSRRCVKALVKAGYVSQAEVSRRAANR